MKKSIPILMLVLLLAKPDWAFTGAKNGLVLWGMVVLPTLMPFMLCSQAVAGLGAVPLFMKPFRPFFTHILHLSDQGGYVLFSGLLCGYPMGAKTCRDFLEKGWIGKAEARFLFAISNHPSPMLCNEPARLCFGTAWQRPILADSGFLVSAYPAHRCSCRPYLPEKRGEIFAGLSQRMGSFAGCSFFFSGRCLFILCRDYGQNWRIHYVVFHSVPLYGKTFLFKPSRPVRTFGNFGNYHRNPDVWRDFRYFPDQKRPLHEKKCRTIHPALCTVENSAWNCFHDYYGAAAIDALLEHT